MPNYCRSFYKWIKKRLSREEIIAFYRLTPRSSISIDDLENWMVMNGHSKDKIPEVIRELGQHPNYIGVRVD